MGTEMEYLPYAFIDHDVSCHFAGRYSHNSMYHDPLNNLYTVQDSSSAVRLLRWQLTPADIAWSAVDTLQ